MNSRRAEGSLTVPAAVVVTVGIANRAADDGTDRTGDDFMQCRLHEPRHFQSKLRKGPGQRGGVVAAAG